MIENDRTEALYQYDIISHVTDHT